MLDDPSPFARGHSRPPAHLRQHHEISSDAESAWLTQQAKLDWIRDEHIPWTLDDLNTRINTVGTDAAISEGLAARNALECHTSGIRFDQQAVDTANAEEPPQEANAEEPNLGDMQHDQR